ncbi:hypothetical protein BH20ACI3_BH20ACI3_10350 [soil metagenome]
MTFRTTSNLMFNRTAELSLNCKSEKEGQNAARPQCSVTDFNVLQDFTKPSQQNSSVGFLASENSARWSRDAFRLSSFCTSEFLCLYLLIQY